MHKFGLRIRSGLVALLLAGCGASPAAAPLAPGKPIDAPAAPAKPPEVPAADERVLKAFPFDKFTKDKAGDLADPTNLAFVCTEPQFREAARKAGWLGADPINAWTSLKMVSAALRHKPYPTAPMSLLYLFGRSQDLSWQIPTDHVAVRDHFRAWETAFRDGHGRPVWVGAGTKDIAIKLEAGTNRTSHQIDPKIDSEREVIVASFVQTGLVERTYRIPGIGHRFEGVNSSGDPYFTDGLVAVIEFKNFPVADPKKK
ncbi:MAG: LssY C-terminal domain-containing protein [Candidatus Sericytochromatia bacterium]|nr:LssY C-terminal domain-containing protein [Candidatus Tanganyikabacteria bacterium]